MKELELLKQAIRAGAYAISSTKRLHLATFSHSDGDISFNKAEIALRFLESHIYESDIDMDSLLSDLENIDSFDIKRGD